MIAPAIQKLFVITASLFITTIGYSQQQQQLQQQDQHARDLLQVYDPTNFKQASLQYTGIPSWFEKAGTHGSRYLSRYWLSGVIESTGNRTTPRQNPCWYTFDKLNNKLLCTKDGINITTLSNDTIRSFALADSNKLYIFEKIPFISSDLFFQPLVKSDKKYSLYKRLITRFQPADFSPVGYYTTGKRYDEYVDYYEYYIVFPGQKKFGKFYLHQQSIRKAFGISDTQMNTFFSRNDGPITEETIISLVNFLNDKVDCCKLMGAPQSAYNSI
jgi:hypothetical protein